jgi:hypothetical protein
MKQFSPGQWSAFFDNQPETGMGYFTGDITLHDGRVFKDAIFAEGRVTQIRGLADIPFETQDVATVRLTHNRWAWDGAQ